jgi:hypothetical protein
MRKTPTARARSKSFVEALRRRARQT